MRRTLPVLLVVLVTTTCPVSACFAANPYFSVAAGVTWLDDSTAGGNFDTEYDTGSNLSAALGYDFGSTRMEAEVAYRQNDADDVASRGRKYEADGEATALSLMANGFLDFVTDSPIVPYLVGGIGVAEVAVNDLEPRFFGEITDDEDTVFAWQLGAGIGFEIEEAMVVDIGYRFFATSDPEFRDEFGEKFDSEYESHNVNVGLRLNF